MPITPGIGIQFLLIKKWLLKCDVIFFEVLGAILFIRFVQLDLILHLLLVLFK